MIKKMTAFTCCLLMTLGAAFAQSDVLKWQPGIKLQYSDFSVDPSTSQLFADITVRYDYTFQPVKSGKYLPIINTEAILNKKTATLPDSSEKSLRYAQLLFDLSGYHSKLIKLKMLELGEMKEKNVPLKTVLDSVIFEANNAASQLKKELTEQLAKSADEQVFSAWETKIAGLLQSTPEITEEKRLANWSFGVFAGIGQSYFSGKTRNYIKTATGMNYGFSIDHKRSRLAVDINLNFNKVNNAFEEGGSWQAGMKTHFASTEITYGVKLPKNNWLTVPYAGLSINELTPFRASTEDKRLLDGFNPVVGLEINRYFSKSSSSWKNLDLFYRLRFSVNPSNLIKDQHGTQFNLKLDIGMDAVRVKRRLVKKS